MRIRKRSIAALSSSPWEKPGTSSTCRGEEVATAAINENDFLLPLVAAVMDVQAKEDLSTGGDGTGIPTAGHEIPEIHKRPVQKWRNALLRCNAEGEAVQVDGEADKSIYRWNGIMRRNREDKSGLLTSEGCVKEATTASSHEKEIAFFDRQEELVESGRPEKCLMWREREVDSDEGRVKKQRSKLQYISHVSAEKEDDIKMRRKETSMTIQSKKDKARGNDKNENVHAGSQCRRRNGRGWRCSERTLVGYFLCEHHLGKGRLKSINSSAGPVVMKYNKATKFKELHLINAAAPPL